MSFAPIRLLDPEVVSRIAAGEVVDRPASVLKELLDNSIDAGSTAIRVLVVEAGLKRLEVEDDGGGLSPEDLKVCTLRHATSKVSNLSDLDAISSLGFRGEALAAIASVSKLQIETFREGSGAWLWQTFGSTQGELIPASRSRGTRVRVEDLFFNVPARKKFLKSVSSEYSETRSILHAVALTHPELSFEWHFINEKGELKEQATLPQSGLVERLRALQQIEGDILFIDRVSPAPGVRRVQAAFYRAPVSSRFQKDIQLSVNGRPVSDKRLPYSLREAYNGLIEVGQYPVGVISLDVDPSEIDVNIHPQKKEIRWPKDFNLASLAYGLLRPHFEVRREQAPLPKEETLSFFNAPRVHQDPAGSSFVSPSALPSSRYETPEAPKLAPSPVFFKREESRPVFRFSELRVVGEVGAAWIICESSQGLILIDQHAAHERVNFERILRSKVLLRSKPLLIPHVQDLPPHFAESKIAVAEVLTELGFEISDESLADKESDTLEFIAVPEADRSIAWNDLLEKIFSDFQAGAQISHWPEHLRMRIAASLSCHGSVRRGQRLANDEIRALLLSMDAVEWGGLCPHGRPVWLPLSHEWVEEQFHR
ncbi:MAG: DNA mismatch repair endonuclease MutL [Bdellovibrionota bacterium]